MAATAAAKNRKVRQEALRDQLSAQGHVQHVVDIATKLNEQHLELETSHIQALRAAADIHLKLINKYLPDLQTQTIEHEGAQEHIHSVDAKTLKALKADILKDL